MSIKHQLGEVPVSLAMVVEQLQVDLWAHAKDKLTQAEARLKEALWQHYRSLSMPDLQNVRVG